MAKIDASMDAMRRLASDLKVRAVRDACGDPVIDGRHGNIHNDGEGFSVAVMCDTARKWSSVRGSLAALGELRQNGDTEGVFHVKYPFSGRRNRTILRKSIGAKKIKDMPPSVLANLRRGNRLSIREEAANGD